MDTLPFDRFRELVNLLSLLRVEERKEKLINGAWIGFQMGAAGEKNFGEYLSGLGLGEKKPATETSITAKEAIKKAERIRASLNKSGSGV